MAANKKTLIPGDYQYRALTRGYPVQRFWHKNKQYLLDKIGNFSANDVILDAGCGSGNISFDLAKKASKVVGLDISNRATSFAKNQAKELRLDNLIFKTADLKKIPFKNDYFTKVVLFEVVEHLNEKDFKEMITELYRVIKPGGLLYITTPNKVSLWPAIEFLLDFFKLTPPLKNHQHILELTISQLEKIMIEGKFKIVDTGSINHLSPFISPFSWQLARAVFNIEIKHFKKFGPIIWMTVKK